MQSLLFKALETWIKGGPSTLRINDLKQAIEKRMDYFQYMEYIQKPPLCLQEESREGLQTKGEKEEKKKLSKLKKRKPIVKQDKTCKCIIF